MGLRLVLAALLKLDLEGSSERDFLRLLLGIVESRQAEVGPRVDKRTWDIPGLLQFLVD